MPGKFKLGSVSLVATLMVIAGCSMLMPPVAAGGVELVELDSKEHNGDSSHIGQISAQLLPNNPPVTIVFSGSKIVQNFATGLWMFRYVPASGYLFLRWETFGVGFHSDLNSNPITFTLVGENAVIWAIYFRTKPPAVGGVIRPINTYMILAPCLAAIGLVATIAAVAVKKRRN